MEQIIYSGANSKETSVTKISSSTIKSFDILVKDLKKMIFSNSNIINPQFLNLTGEQIKVLNYNILSFPFLVSYKQKENNTVSIGKTIINNKEELKNIIIKDLKGEYNIRKLLPKVVDDIFILISPKGMYFIKNNLINFYEKNICFPNVNIKFVYTFSVGTHNNIYLYEIYSIEELESELNDLDQNISSINIEEFEEGLQLGLNALKALVPVKNNCIPSVTNRSKIVGYNATMNFINFISNEKKIENKNSIIAEFLKSSYIKSSLIIHDFITDFSNVEKLEKIEKFDIQNIYNHVSIIEKITINQLQFRDVKPIIEGNKTVIRLQFRDCIYYKNKNIFGIKEKQDLSLHQKFESDYVIMFTELPTYLDDHAKHIYLNLQEIDTDFSTYYKNISDKMYHLNKSLMSDVKYAKLDYDKDSNFFLISNSKFKFLPKIIIEKIINNIYKNLGQKETIDFSKIEINTI